MVESLGSPSLASEKVSSLSNALRVEIESAINNDAFFKCLEGSMPEYTVAGVKAFVKKIPKKIYTDLKIDKAKIEVREGWVDIGEYVI